MLFRKQIDRILYSFFVKDALDLRHIYICLCFWSKGWFLLPAAVSLASLASVWSTVWCSLATWQVGGERVPVVMETL